MQTMTDAELVEAYSSQNDEAAFEELTRRHSALVYRACLRMLKDPHEAEDASQAVFMVLARKAGGLRKGDVAVWLYRVAHYVAAEMVRKRMRRTNREEAYAVNETIQSGEFASEDGSDPVVLGLVDQALQTLPKHYRDAVVLRYLENLSVEEAARITGCTCGALAVRAHRGLEQLRGRLARLGAATSVTALVGMLSAEASAAVPETLFVPVLAAVKGTGAAGLSPGFGAIAEGAMKAMFMAKVKTMAAVCVSVVLLGATAVGVAVTLPLVLNQHDQAPDLKPLLSEDPWVSGLLARADAGTWDALDFGQCNTREKDARWLVEKCTGAERRIWSLGPGGDILFDKAEWKRGVLVGRLMRLPDGGLPPTLAPPDDAVPVQPVLSTAGGVPETTGPKEAAEILLYHGTRTAPDALSYKNRVVFQGLAALGTMKESANVVTMPLFPRKRREWVVGANGSSSRGIRGGPDVEVGVWYRCCMYLDHDSEQGALLVGTVWREGVERPPPVAEWSRIVDASCADAAVGLGLRVRGGSILWQGLKFVPLGPEMPSPPSGSSR